MSKGPFTARINQIDTAENFHILQVEQLTEQFFHGQKETLKVPVDERLSSLRSGDVITYYRAEEEYVITETPHSEERIVLLFKRSSDGLGLPEKRCLWIAPGKPLMQLPDLPRIVQILLGLSSYYGKREDLVRAALDILALSQDAEAIDALCSQFVRICWINCWEWNMRLFPCKLPIRSLLWLWPVPIWNTRAAAICGRFCLWRCSTAKLRPRFMTLSLHTNANKA